MASSPATDDSNDGRRGRERDGWRDDPDLPVLRGDEARSVDLDVTERLGRVRVLEGVATRLADAIEYHVLAGVGGTDPIGSGSGDRRDTPILFVAGKGNNGANALACARMLHLRGFGRVDVVPLVKYPPDPASPALRPNISEQLELFGHFVGTSAIHPLDMDRIRDHRGVIVDGVLGTGIDRPPRGVSADAIRAMMEAAGSSSSSSGAETAAARVLSIDVPSGLNHETGVPPDPSTCVRATWTVNLHMLKSGQLEASAREYVGELWSVESGLGYVTFPADLPERFRRFYAEGPIRKVFLDET